MSNPDLYVDIRREDFFKSLLSKRVDGLLFSARALVEQVKNELLAKQEGSVIGIKAGIGVNKQPMNSCYTMSCGDQQKWHQHMIRSTRVSFSTEPSS